MSVITNLLTAINQLADNEVRTTKHKRMQYYLPSM